MKRCIVLFFILFSTLSGEGHYLSIVAIFRDEAPYLKEWIEYHRLVGVDHFYLYNHGSTDEYYRVLRPYVEEGTVELIQWNYPVKNRVNWIKTQVLAYQDGLKRAIGKSRWVAIIDLDEFIFPKEVWTIPEFLQEYEEYSGVGINWQTFGTSGIQKLDPKKLMIEQLLKRGKSDLSINRYVKSIVKPETCAYEPEHRLIISGADWSAHKPQFLPGCQYVDVNKKGLNYWKTESLTQDIICVHHYKFRDEEFFHNVKLKRPNLNEAVRNLRLKESYSANEVYDTSILRYKEALRSRVFGR